MRTQASKNELRLAKLNKAAIGADSLQSRGAAVGRDTKDREVGRSEAERSLRAEVSRYDMVADRGRPRSESQTVRGSGVHRTGPRANRRDLELPLQHVDPVRLDLLAECERLRAELAEAREVERRRLARDLHDHAGQSIVGIMMRLSAAESGAADERSRAELRSVREAVQNVGDQLHELAVSLRDSSRATLPLSEILGGLIRDWCEQTAIPVESDYDPADLDGLAEPIAGVVHRVVQEALTNVAKHATGATRAILRVTFSDSTVRVSIQDDGAGFSPVVRSAGSEGGGRVSIGLVGMRERLADVAGHLRIVSEPGSGTIVAAILPRWDPSRMDGQA